MSASAEPPRRVRVVLADRRPAPRPLTARTELEEQTPVGRELLRGLLRAQLRLALGTVAAAAVLVGTWPLLFALVPALGDLRLLGVGAVWWVLAVVVPVVLSVLARWHVRRVDALEAEFAEPVDPAP